jgi:Ca2+-binding EF-hand superfamily protein
MQSKFDSLDVNHDGYIDKQEAAADSKLKNQFAKVDANKDAKLSITEFSSAKGLAMNKKAKSTDSSDESGKKQQ